MSNYFAELFSSDTVFTVEGAAIRPTVGGGDAAPPASALPASGTSDSSGTADVGTQYALTSTGERVDLESAVVFGRSPSGEGRCVTLSSPLISSNHLRIERVDGVLVAVDLDSTNGTLLRREQYPEYALPPLQPVPLYRGDILDFDLGLSVQIC
jgi:pSer/pThr/pTyr-binding forkhead associated (FHA) protein